MSQTPSSQTTIQRSAYFEGRGSSARRTSLRTRLLTAFTLLAILPALITGAVATLVSAQGLRNSVFEELESVATLKENEIQEWLKTLQTTQGLIFENQQVRQGIYTLLQNNQDTDVNLTQLRNGLSRFAEKTGYFIELFVMNEGGEIILSTNESQEGKIQTNQPFFQNGLKGSFISPPAYEVSLNSYSIVLSEPIKTSGGVTIGVMGARVNLNALSAIMQQQTGLGEAGETYLVSSNFAALTNLYHTELSLGETYIRTRGATNAITEKSSGSAAYVDYAGNSTFGVYHWIPELQVALIAEHDEQEALQASDRVLQITGALITLTALLAVFLAFLVTRAITTPISKLAAAADEIARGNLDLQAEVTRNDEIGILAHSFNTMTSRLRELISNLEQRVAQRTQALSASGEISRKLSSILDKETLAVEVVNQLKSAFNYYHAHIYLTDETGKELAMAGGTGEVGKTLLSREHKIPYGKGLVGRAAANKEVVLIPDTAQEPNWLPNPLLPETKSEIAVPIIAGNEVLGVLDVQNNAVDSLTQQDAALLRSIADQVAIALQNISTTETIAKRADELQKVAKVNATTSALIDDEQKMLAQIVHLTQRQFGLYHAHVFIFDEKTQILQIKACGWREGDEREGTHGTAKIHLSQEQSLVARAARSQQPVIVNDVRRDAGWLPNPLLPDTAAELAVPLLAGDKLIGVLDVQADRVNAFSEEDASIQSILASQIAIAIQNVRIYQEIRQKAEREALVGSINQKIQSAVTVEDAMQIAIRELGHALSTQTQIKLYGHNGGT